MQAARGATPSSMQLLKGQRRIQVPSVIISYCPLLIYVCLPCLLLIFPSIMLLAAVILSDIFCSCQTSTLPQTVQHGMEWNKRG